MLKVINYVTKIKKYIWLTCFFVIKTNLGYKNRLKNVKNILISVKIILFKRLFITSVQIERYFLKQNLMIFIKIDSKKASKYQIYWPPIPKCSL